jgi:hypothetical protein
MMLCVAELPADDIQGASKVKVAFRHKAGTLVPITVSRWMEVKIVAGAKPYPRTNLERGRLGVKCRGVQTIRHEHRHRLQVLNNDMYKDESG